jgi:hypothetical protein
MPSRFFKFQTELQNQERGATAHFVSIRREENVASIVHKDAIQGMGTKNFFTEILDIYAMLDRDRKQKLIDYSSHLAEQQRAEQRVGCTGTDAEVMAILERLDPDRQDEPPRLSGAC